MPLILHREESERRVIYTLVDTSSVWTIWDGLVLTFIVYLGLSQGLWTWLSVLTSLVWVQIKSRHVLQESLLIIPNIGLQLEVKRGFIRTGWMAGLLNQDQVVFLVASSIQDVFINEALTRWTVVYYLALLVKGQTKLIIVFRVSRAVKKMEQDLCFSLPQELSPDVKTLQPVWQELRDVFFNTKPDPRTKYRVGDGAAAHSD